MECRLLPYIANVERPRIVQFLPGIEQPLPVDWYAFLGPNPLLDIQDSAIFLDVDLKRLSRNYQALVIVIPQFYGYSYAI